MDQLRCYSRVTVWSLTDVPLYFHSLLYYSYNRSSIHCLPSYIVSSPTITYPSILPSLPIRSQTVLHPFTLPLTIVATLLHNAKLSSNVAHTLTLLTRCQFKSTYSLTKGSTNCPYSTIIIHSPITTYANLHYNIAHTIH